MLTEKWREHKWTLDGHVEQLPCEWIKRFANKTPSDTTNLKDGTIVNMEDLWTNLMNDGLCDPLIMRIGRIDGKARLEAGNHRINVAMENGITHLPVVVEIADFAVGHRGNGNHKYDTDIIYNGDEMYAAPSKVFGDIQKIKEELPA